jgi:hypothetical protein
MRTPAGKECKYFYGNYYRGRNHEECRLLGDSPIPQNWTRDLCTNCPVPDILRANACKHMELTGMVHRPFPFFKRQVSVSAYCNKCHCEVAEPHIGCGECHTLPSIFTGALDDTDSSH